MKKPSGPRGTEGQRAEEVGWFAGSDALMKYEDSGHAPTVLPGTVPCQPADTLVSASGPLSRGSDAQVMFIRDLRVSRLSSNRAACLSSPSMKLDSSVRAASPSCDSPSSSKIFQ